MGREKRPNYDITSFSRLDAYQSCSKFYERRYINKEPIVYPFRPPIVRGNFVHSVIEEIMDPETKTEELDDALYIHFSTFLENTEVDLDQEEVWEFANAFGELCWRATELCQDPEITIRKADGDIPKDIENYPPKSWTNAIKKSGLTSTKYDLDNAAARNNPAFEKMSFSYFLGTTFAMLKGFKVPDWVEEIVAVEKGFSTDDFNKLKLPRQKQLYFNGYMDAVVRTNDGRLIILDHKTSKKKPTQQTVQNLPQLNLYAWGYKVVYGEWPTHIGIHHVRSGEYVIASVDKEAVKETLLFYDGIQAEGIDSGTFVKRHPEDYRTPCVKKDYTTNEVTETCPYLETCWPTYYKTLQADDYSRHSEAYSD